MQFLQFSHNFTELLAFKGLFSKLNSIFAVLKSKVFKEMTFSQKFPVEVFNKPEFNFVLFSPHKLQLCERLFQFKNEQQQ